MTYGFIHTEHCPGSSMEDQFRARIGVTYKTTVPAKYVDLFTPEAWEAFTTARFYAYHDKGSILSPEDYLN